MAYLSRRPLILSHLSFFVCIKTETRIFSDKFVIIFHSSFSGRIGDHPFFIVTDIFLWNAFSWNRVIIFYNSNLNIKKILWNSTPFPFLLPKIKTFLSPLKASKIVSVVSFFWNLRFLPPIHSSVNCLLCMIATVSNFCFKNKEKRERKKWVKAIYLCFFHTFFLTIFFILPHLLLKTYFVFFERSVIFLAFRLHCSTWSITTNTTSNESTKRKKSKHTKHIGRRLLLFSPINLLSQ